MDKHDEISKNVSEWVGMLGAAGPRYKHPKPSGYGISARKSTINPNERKKRTAKKKAAKRSRKRNR